ncbi:hypothetical protein [Luteitalea sp.]|uniref:hypothetical protein n=1 Tax=Luteitalea sp. TaxID=2004800 RepID=UPI0025C55811|nr:hypothetical protein [Luteitalea sp.]
MPVFLEGTGDIGITIEWVNRHGHRIDLRDFRNVLVGLSTTEEDRLALARRLKRLGIVVRYGMTESPPPAAP